MNKFFIIDGNSYIYRAFHAIKHLKNRDGFPTNAIFGFTNMLLNVLDEKPDYIAVVFDAAKKTFRNDIFEFYKANRPPMPDDLVVQLPFIKKIVESFNIKKFEKEGVEADDIIASLVESFKDKSKITIISSDKDLLQLVDENVIMWDTLKDNKFTKDNIIKKFGVQSDFIVDYLALIGDKSDNIPGVKGIGPKAAVKLIEEFGTIEQIYNNIEKIKNPRIQKLLTQNKKNAFLSKKLIQLKKNIPLNISLKDLKFIGPNFDKLKQIFEELDFHSFLKKFNINIENDKSFKFNYSKNFPKSNKISGLLITYQDGFYLGVYGGFTANGKDIFLNAQVEALKNIKIKKFITFNFKHHLKILNNLKNLKINDFEDIQLIAYLLDPEIKTSIENISLYFLKKFIRPLEDYKPKKNIKMKFEKLNNDEKKIFIAERVVAIYKSFEELSEKLNDKLKKIYNTIEKPLLEILHKMESYGIYIDIKILEDLNKQISKEIDILKENIYRAAGEEFNINSPLQLRKIFFEKLKLDVIKKTKTGPSTDNEVLIALSEKHELPALILSYREKTKLKNTYIDSLMQLIDKDTSRIHPTFNQTITATGRLSCENPNIQNIPIRGEHGSEIRKAFAAPEGKVIISIDYSQIELRLMAHFSEDESLLEAFEKNIDIHAFTAAKIYGKDLNEIDETMRRVGKTVNFSIIYGISPFGLAKSLKITREKAKIFIDNYFKEYPKIKNFVERCVNDAKEKGFVETILGRRRYIKNINSKNHQEKEFAKRIAVNTPIQGSAADIIKLAMIEMDKILYKFNANLIMQVHDELVFEVDEKNYLPFIEKGKEIMENIMPQLKVKLKVEAGAGKNWFEAH